MNIIYKTLLILLLCSCNIAYAGEEDLYDFLWLDPDKKVFVLQNKVHPKKNKFFVDAGYVYSLTSKYQSTTGAKIKASYFFNENFGIELGYTTYANENNSAYENLKVINGTVPFIRRSLSNTTISAIWSPFYGKINTFNHIYYFDWSFGIGTGSFITESNLKTVLDPSQKDRYEAEHYTPLILTTKFRFHINDKINLGIEFTNINFEASSPKRTNTKEWEMNNDISVSLGVSF